MLTTSADRLAPARPDRAEPPCPAADPLPPTVPEAAPAQPVPPAPAPVPGPVPATPATAAVPAAVTARPQAAEARGCLYALSQPPLMLFLCVIGGLIGAGAVWDLLAWW